MMDVFESMESDLNATWKQNEILKNQLLEATLEHDVEKCVLMCLDSMNDDLNNDIEKVKRESIDNTNCEYSLKNLCKTSWISKIEKLENENVSLGFQVQSLLTERENIKLEYQKLFDSIKRTRTQSQKEINELIESVNQKTYAYGDVRAHNQDLLITISELKAKLKTIEKVKSVNTKFDKPLVSGKLLCVTPINKQILQKKKFIPKTEEKHVLTKTVTLQTSPTKKKHVDKNTNVIALGMYKVNTTNKQESKSVLTSTKLKDVTSVRRSSSRSSSPKKSVLSNNKNYSEYVKVRVRTNKKTYVTSKKNVVQTKKIVIDVDVKKALKAKDVLCVSCDKNVLTRCHDKCVAKHKLSVNSKFRRALFTTPRTTKSKSLDTTPIVAKTSRDHAVSNSNTSVLIRKWVAKLSTLPFVFSSCGASALKMITLQHSLDMEIMYMAMSPSVMYTMLKVLDTTTSIYGSFFSCFPDVQSHFNKIMDRLCSTYERGKSKKATLPPKLVPSTHSKLELIHMDLCELLRVESINRKKYILVIVDDYSRYTWKVRTDNGTEFKNATLQAHYEKLEATRTMLIFSKSPEFLWAEAISTACFTQNRSLIHTRYNKTPYELLRGRKPNVEYFQVFTSLYYPTNNREDLGKMKPKADIGIFVGYSESSKGFQIYNLRTKKTMETIHVKFNELTAMASKHNCLEPETNRFNNDDSSADYTSIPSKEDLDHLFGPMYEEYFKKRSPEVFVNSAPQPTPNKDDTPSSSSIIVEDQKASPVVSSSKEHLSPISSDAAVESVQKDSTDFDGNTLFTPYDSPTFEEAKSSSIAVNCIEYA
ncbi:retrovirus-related pol polyprotein from transposon TNT 1-94 [Tanacetum coccineum]